MASSVTLNSTNNSEMNIVYQGTSGATRTVVVPDKNMTVAGTDEVIGVGQTWQDVKASRALGNVYTNNTGKPISVHVWLSSTVGEAGITVDINSVPMFGAICLANTKYGGITFIVPNNTTYKVYVTAGVGTVSLWSELR